MKRVHWQARIALITIWTDEIEPMKRFYSDVLGFPVKNDLGDYVELESPGVRFAICRRSVMAEHSDEFSRPASGQAFELAFPLRDSGSGRRGVRDRSRRNGARLRRASCGYAVGAANCALRGPERQYPRDLRDARMIVTPDMIDPELRLRGQIVDLINTRSSEQQYRRHVRRVQRAMRLLAGCRVPGVDTQEVRVPRRDGESVIRVLVMRRRGERRSGERLPSEGRQAPGIVWIHGGGYAIGVPEVDSRIHRMLVLERGCVVVAPDYQVSTEAPYPAALDDCYDTLIWMKENASELGIRADQLMVGGGSAGGGLTAAVSLRARDTGEVQIALQFPLYPMLDDRMETESVRENNAPVWNSDTNRWAWRLYLGDRFGGDVPAWAAPARAEDFHGLPPTVTFVGDLEPFRDETIAYVDRLRNAGVPVRFEVFERCFHAFDVVHPRAAVSERARAFWTESLPG